MSINGIASNYLKKQISDFFPIWSYLAEGWKEQKMLSRVIAVICQNFFCFTSNQLDFESHLFLFICKYSNDILKILQALWLRKSFSLFEVRLRQCGKVGELKYKRRQNAFLGIITLFQKWNIKNRNLFIYKTNQIFHYTRCIAPKRVRSWQSPSSSHGARTLQRWQAVGNTVSNLTCPRFEPQTSPFSDKLFNQLSGNIKKIWVYVSKKHQQHSPKKKSEKRTWRHCVNI